MIYLLLTVTVNGMQQVHPVDISPIDSHCYRHAGDTSSDISSIDSHC